MSGPLPLILIAPPGPARDRVHDLLSATLADHSPEVLGSTEEGLDRLSGREEGAGVALLGPDLPAEDVLNLLRSQRDRERPWVTLVLEREGGEDGDRDGEERLIARPLSLGHALSPAEVAAKAEDPEAEGPILELHWILRIVATARHDLNNPLTSGLAEVQLLLMDEHPPEQQESLETIQDQFRRLRDLVQKLARLRVPRRARES